MKSIGSSNDIDEFWSISKSSWYTGDCCSRKV